MLIKLGFVSTALAVYNNTPSSTFTYKLFSQKPREEAMERAIEVGRNNLHATQRILYYCAAHGIRLLRMSSALIPLATHPDVMLDVATIYKTELQKLGEFARANGIRLSMHPSQFTLLNGADKVLRASIADLEYHAALLDGMGLPPECNINIHVGGVYGDKAAAIERLYHNYSQVPEQVRNRLTFENDDKTYTTQETLEVCEQLKLPFVLDLHHDWCNPSDESPLELVPRILKTWGEVSPKIHVSSPRNEKDFRAHAEYVDSEGVLPYLKRCKETGLEEINVMLEAKSKDLALFKLAEDLAKVRGIKRLDGGILQW